MNLETIEQAVSSTGIKICTYGPAGVGKTVLSTTTGKPTIILSAEAGLLSIAHLPPEIAALIRIIQIKSTQDVGSAYHYLMSQRMCDWVVIDSLSEIAEVLLSDKKKAMTDPRKAYAEMADEMLDMIRMFRDLPGYNVMMTAKQTRFTDQGTGITSYVPLMPGRQVGNQIAYLFDEVFALRVVSDESGQVHRILQTGKDVQYDCKDRSGCLNMYEPANLAQIQQKIESRRAA